LRTVRNSTIRLTGVAHFQSVRHLVNQNPDASKCKPFSGLGSIPTGSKCAIFAQKQEAHFYANH
jgi:hypothetical protein